MSDLLALLLSLVLFPVVFVGFWSMTCVLLGFVSGWRRMARRYGTDAPPPPRDLGWTSGSVGLIGYRNTLVPAATPDALDLRVMRMFRPGHPPLRIPWRDIREDGTDRWFLIPMVTLRIDDGPRVRISQEAWTRLQAERG